MEALGPRKAELKNMLADKGIYPPGVDKVIHTFEQTGRTTPINPAVAKNRARFGLPELEPVPMEEITPLLEPADQTGGDS